MHLSLKMKPIKKENFLIFCEDCKLSKNDKSFLDNPIPSKFNFFTVLAYTVSGGRGGRGLSSELAVLRRSNYKVYG